MKFFSRAIAFLRIATGNLAYMPYREEKVTFEYIYTISQVLLPMIQNYKIILPQDKYS
ncbi:hypothetical protein [Calothrix sp. 336/3]|uniref:hypothetical protein n=1 Tax=Calothrix sp. 336/3 TaxID=1337936 RepID=UPI00143BBC1A|nr:hypothetical protein [Calothrix sp. 336/3]